MMWNPHKTHLHKTVKIDWCILVPLIDIVVNFFAMVSLHHDGTSQVRPSQSDAKTSAEPELRSGYNQEPRTANILNGHGLLFENGDLHWK